MGGEKHQVCKMRACPLPLTQGLGLYLVLFNLGSKVEEVLFTLEVEAQVATDMN